ncbi:MAG: helix-turn-helix transcriptional regulator [Proteobacteria bacterium]|nr:helix-turn-helix transcriptional regulator [Pseudomonadota bacterium]
MADSRAPKRLSRQQLQVMVRTLDRSRDRSSDDEMAEYAFAVEVWQGMLAGEWSLLDHFDLDGRHYIVVRRRPPEPSRQLSGRERCVVIDAICGRSNKAIAYRLGIAPSTVATYLRRALAKLGVRSRTELLRVIPHAALASESAEAAGPNQAGPGSGSGDAVLESS